MSTRTVRIDIPIYEKEKMITLGSDIRDRHTALGAASPLNNSIIDMTAFAAIHQLAKDKRTEGLDAHSFGQAAIQAADLALGIGALQTIDTPSTVYYYTGRIRSQLLLAYQGVEEEAS
ncbi:MAG: hypothetical protein HY840_03150, partial [Bacteroidetes bacterium]|nr:hypothetical protein [Bacteroidota bacterium]